MSPRVNAMMEDPAEEPIPLDAPQPEAEEVRITNAKVSVALPPRQYHFLVEFCAQATRTTGAKAKHVDIMRALLAELVADEQLRNRVLARLRGQASEQVGK